MTKSEEVTWASKVSTDNKFPCENAYFLAHQFMLCCRLIPWGGAAMHKLIYIGLVFSFCGFAEASLAVQMKVPGSVPKSMLYNLSGIEQETSAEQVAQFLSQELQNKTTNSKTNLEKSDLKKSLATLSQKNDSVLDIRHMNKIETFSNKNKSEVYQAVIGEKAYQIYVSNLKNLVLIIEP